MALVRFAARKVSASSMTNFAIAFQLLLSRNNLFDSQGPVPNTYFGNISCVTRYSYLRVFSPF